MNPSIPTPALRPYLPSDAPALAELFRESIHELTGEDYSPGQQAAWAERADDEEAFADRLAGGLTLVATIAGEPFGFIVLKAPDVVDMLYVHPSAAGQGLASMLIDAVEKLAAARGAKRLVVDASDTALGFFETRGFKPQRRNSIALGREWLGNTTMEKALGAARS